jgi:hypothetical protein
MNKPQHPNVPFLLALNPIYIQGLDQDLTSQHIGMTIGLTA